MTSNLITFDIDGTLAHVPQMLSEDWDHLATEGDLENRFYANLDLADPHLPGFFKHLKSLNFDIGIITARSMRDKTTTIEWLASKGFVYEWLVVNMNGTERVDFLRSILPGMHFDDHPQAVRYRKTIPVWYNAWEKPLEGTYYEWPWIYTKYGYTPTPQQLSLF